MEEISEILVKLTDTLAKLVAVADNQETRLQRIEVRLGLRVEEVAK